MSCEKGKIRNNQTYRASECSRSWPCVPQESKVTPAYGSLYGSTTLASPNTYVNFLNAGPFNGTTPSITDNSITVHSQGVYNISFSTEIDAFGPQGTFDNIVFRIHINGNFTGAAQISFQTSHALINEVDTLSRTDQFMLNQGDVVKVFVPIVNGDIGYLNPALVVTKIA